MNEEYRTLKDWFGDATRGDGRKFRMKTWEKDHYCEPVFFAKDYELDELVWHAIDSDGYRVVLESPDAKYEEWHPPKKKKKLWLWAYRDSQAGYYVTSKFYEEPTEEEKYIDWIKLEHTEIEVPCDD